MSEKRFSVLPNNVVWDNQLNEVVCRCILEGIGDAENVCQRLNEQQAIIEYLTIEKHQADKRFQTIIAELKKENEKLRQMIKENVFQRYSDGSLADLEFKAIAYDDIVRVEMPNELEPRVIVYCKQGKKDNIMSYCQMFIPFGIAYEIKEVVDDE